MEEALLKAKGVDGQLELLEDKVLIKHEGLAAKMSGKGGDKEIPVSQIASVEFKNATSWVNGYIQLVSGGQEARTGLIERSKHENTVSFRFKQREPFETFKQAVEQRIAEREGPAEVPTEVEDITDEPTSKVAGGVEVLSQKLKKLAEEDMADGEDIQFCLRGVSEQAIVALRERLLIIKPGWRAGAAFGARVTSFYYRDINGIEVNTGLVTGVIELNTPSYQGTTQKDYWSTKNPDRDPFKVTNCLPIVKSRLKDYKPYIDRLRATIREVKQERVSPAPSWSGDSLASELEKLASLRASGVLNDEEFERAKKKLLS